MLSPCESFPQEGNVAPACPHGAQSTINYLCATLTLQTCKQLVRTMRYAGARGAHAIARVNLHCRYRVCEDRSIPTAAGTEAWDTAKQRVKATVEACGCGGKCGSAAGTLRVHAPPPFA